MVYPRKEFEKASCKDANLDKSSLIEMFQKIEKEKFNIHSMMLVHQGAKVFDCYAHDFGPEVKEEIYSASKSFTSIAIGILIDRDLIQLDQTVLSFFQNEVKNYQPGYELLTIRHLLTMSVGYESDILDSLNENDNLIEKFFQIPLVHKPGTTFLYSNYATLMLSEVITKVTGELLNDFLDRELFQKLEIDKPVWKGVQNINYGAWGLHISARDMAKFGLLLLNDGKWRDEQIVSKAYLDMATSFQISTQERDKPSDQFGYGFQFWVNGFGDYRATGWLNQHIIINKQHQLVFVMQAYEERDLVHLFTDYILKAKEQGWTYSNLSLRDFIRDFTHNSTPLVLSEKQTRTIY